MTDFALAVNTKDVVRNDSFHADPVERVLIELHNPLALGIEITLPHIRIDGPPVGYHDVDVSLVKVPVQDFHMLLMYMSGAFAASMAFCTSGTMRCGRMLVYRLPELKMMRSASAIFVVISFSILIS